MNEETCVLDAAQSETIGFKLEGGQRTDCCSTLKEAEAPRCVQPNVFFFFFSTPRADTWSPASKH